MRRTLDRIVNATILVATVIATISLSLSEAQRQNLPDLSSTSNAPIRVSIGDDIIVDCIIKNRNNLTVLWKYVNGTSETLLAANQVMVSEDKRMQIIHESSQDRWSLQIRYARLQDTGIYKCEVNSVPKVYETRMVMVSVKKTYAEVLKKAIGSLTNVTERVFNECCQTEGVPILCRPLCSLSSMLSDQTKPYMYTLCYNYMPHIYRCISDGRNHLPCCQRQKVPELCQPSCTGQYKLDKALDHAACHEHSKTILYCIADGLQVLPEQPQDISADAINATHIRLSWMNREGSQANEYKIMYKALTSFDEHWKRQDNSTASELGVAIPQMLPPPESTEVVIISANKTEYIIGPVPEATMFEIRMISTNKFGESLPTTEIRVVTHALNEPKPVTGSSLIDEVEEKKKAPNLRKCCVDKGVKTDACLKQLCEPFIIEPVEIEDSIMCMKYMNTSYKCIEEIREQNDYEKCCEEEGVSGFCKHFCSGKTSLLGDFQAQFQCLPYMSSLVSCVLERKGFVSTEPRSVSVSSVHTDWALVKWTAPLKRPETVTKYQIHYREMSEEADDFYFVEMATKSPFLVDKLKPSTRYEIFVTAVNLHGVSRGSSRVLFNTTTPEVSAVDDLVEDVSARTYNETICCEKAGVQAACLPLCNYHLKMTDLFKLSLFCAEPKTARSILRCLAGGRDHRSCCERRGIDSDCHELCNGMITFTNRETASKCSKFDGKIFQCMAEGADTLPGMPVGLHAANFTPTSVGIAWNRSEDDSTVIGPVQYQIRYTPLGANKTIPPHPFDDRYSSKMNVTNTRFMLNNLSPNTSYSIYVVSTNQYGNSAPSQVLLITTPSANETTNTDMIQHSSIGPPHGLELIRKSITVLVFRWSEPHYSAPDVTYSYEIFFQKVKALTQNNDSMNSSKWIVMNSATNVVAIQNLTRNTQYAIAVRARTSNGQVSPLSETVLAWTDPSLPLEISQPFIHPFPVIEGSMVTIRCESIGYPIPNMTIYVNGERKKSVQSRIIHYSVDYVERNLTAIACQAVNEESKHPVQSFREVNVHFAPTITLRREIVESSRFAQVMLECEFSGFPKPKIRFLRDSQMISRFNNSRVFPHLKKPKTWVATFVIPNVDKTDEGDYDCIARNDYGEEKKTIKLMVNDIEHVVSNHTECCSDKNVPNECMYICERSEINLFDVYKNQKCLEHLNKYVSCAADGSDHRRCCMFREVPSDCLHWCAGYKTQKMDYCLVSSARDVMSCFKEGNKFLPSPPVSVQVDSYYSNSHLRIRWEDSPKNRDSEHWYWVYWKRVGTNDIDRERIETNSFELRNLEPDATYEFVVKTSNYHGTSVLSKPLVIQMSSMSQARFLTSESEMMSSVFMTFFFLLLIFGTIAIIVYYSHRNNILQIPKIRLGNGGSPRGSCDNIGVSFENRAYVNGDNIPMREQSPNDTAPATIIAESTTSSASGSPSSIARNSGANREFANEFAIFSSDQNNNPGQQGRVQIQGLN